MKNKNYGSVKNLQNYLNKSYGTQKDKIQIMDFFDSSLEDRLMPKKKIWLYVNEILDKSWAFNYSNPQGDEGLRMKLAEWYLNNNKLANDFIVTSGAQEALVIIIQYLNKITKSKLKVGIEEFSYIGFRHILEENGCEIKPLKLTDQGLDLDGLEKELKRGLDLIYLIPDLQNPTGIVYSKKNREKIVELQKKYNFWLIFDLSYRDLFFDDSNRPSIEMFKNEKTFMVGSFSKTLFPALRIGWLYMPKIDQELLYVRRSIDLFQPTFLQLAISKYLDCDYANHLKYVKSVIKDKKNLLIQELKENGFENTFKWNDVSGGYYLWLENTANKDCTAEITEWAKMGVIAAPGHFFNSNLGANYIRLCFSRLNTSQIREAINRITYLKNKKTKIFSNFYSEIITNGKIWLKNIND